MAAYYYGATLDDVVLLVGGERRAEAFQGDLRTY